MTDTEHSTTSCSNEEEEYTNQRKFIALARFKNVKDDLFWARVRPKTFIKVGPDLQLAC